MSAVPGVGVAVALFLVALLWLVIAVAFVGAVVLELRAGTSASRQLVVVELRCVAFRVEPRSGDHAGEPDQLLRAAKEDPPGERRKVGVEVSDARAMRERRHDAQLRVERDADVRCRDAWERRVEVVPLEVAQEGLPNLWAWVYVAADASAERSRFHHWLVHVPLFIKAFPHGRDHQRALHELEHVVLQGDQEGLHRLLVADLEACEVGSPVGAKLVVLGSFLIEDAEIEDGAGKVRGRPWHVHRVQVAHPVVHDVLLWVGRQADEHVAAHHLPVAEEAERLHVGPLEPLLPGEQLPHELRPLATRERCAEQRLDLVRMVGAPTGQRVWALHEEGVAENVLNHVPVEIQNGRHGADLVFGVGYGAPDGGRTTAAGNLPIMNLRKVTGRSARLTTARPRTRSRTSGRQINSLH